MKERKQKLVAAVIAGAVAALLFMNIKAEANSTLYTVKKKDTLYSISKKYHVTEKQLKEANGLTSGKIYIGQKLLMPDHIEVDIQRGPTVIIRYKKEIPFTPWLKNSLSHWMN